MGRKISETKATCKGCGNVYFYGKTDELQNCASGLSNCGSDLETTSKSAMCCSGCLPAAFIPDSPKQKTINYDKCPRCGSRAVKKEKVVHEV